MSKKISHRQRVELPQRVVNTLDLRQGSRTSPVPARRRHDARGGRQGVRTQLRREVLI
jgi:hypothetical protein